MNYNEVLTRLIYLTKRNNISQTEIGEAIGLDRRAVSGRAERNSKFKPEEVLLLQNAYNVDLSVISIVNNSAERQFDTSIELRLAGFGKRLSLLQAKHNFLDREMATLLNISEIDYINLILSRKLPDLAIINKLKQNFKISVDDLLYGDS